MTVKRWQSSIQRGQNAGYAVTISTVNGSASDVTVTLASQPASQKPTFTKGCAKNGTASCKVSSVTDKQPFALEAQIAVAGNATSVTSVKLTATASIVTTVKWTPPAAAETVTVSSASPSPSPSSSSPAPPASSPGPAVPLGPVPSDLNNTSSSIIGAGNAAGLLPTIAPSGTSAQAAGSNLANGGGNASPVSNSYPLALGTTVVPAQVAGLIALALALLLTMTRLSTRRRPAAKNAKDPKDPTGAKDPKGPGTQGS